MRGWQTASMGMYLDLMEGVGGAEEVMGMYLDLTEGIEEVVGVDDDASLGGLEQGRVKGRVTGHHASDTTSTSSGGLE